MSSELPVYTWEEIKKHNKEEDCWVVINDKVLDVTKFLNEHPGGLNPINDMAGEDITGSFESIGHSSTAVVKSKSMIIGKLDPSCQKKKPVSVEPRPRWTEADAKDLKHYKGATKIIPLPAIIAGVVVLIALLVVLFR